MMPVSALRLPFFILILLSSTSTSAETSQNEVKVERLGCFLDNFDSYRDLANATSYLVINFETCPILPNGDEILQAVLAAMNSNMSNSLGSVKFAGESEQTKFRVFTLKEATCIRNWVSLLDRPDTEYIDLAQSGCFDK